MASLKCFFPLGKHLKHSHKSFKFFIWIIKLKRSLVQLQVAIIVFFSLFPHSEIWFSSPPQGSVCNQEFPLLASFEMHSSWIKRVCACWHGKYSNLTGKQNKVDAEERGNEVKCKCLIASLHQALKGYSIERCSLAWGEKEELLFCLSGWFWNLCWRSMLIGRILLHKEAACLFCWSL